MPLWTGTRFGPYAIPAPIGAGEVYNSRDTRLGRVAADNIFDEEFSEGFERDARAVAPLSIRQLRDVEPNYVVMVYIDGRFRIGTLPDSAATPRTVLQAWKST